MASEVVKPWWRETLETIAWALVLAFIIRTFVIQAFWIPSGSMLPTLMEGDRVLVAKFWNWFAEPKRGHIYVFKYPEDRSRDFIKRVIAVPGDTVDIIDGVVYVNNSPVDEPYVTHKQNHYTMSKDANRAKIYTDFPFVVPEGKYFALGDNRPNSQDGRYWGYVPKEDLHGPAFFRYWPLTRIGLPR